jgi:hypothetical protein
MATTSGPSGPTSSSPRLYEAPNGARKIQVLAGQWKDAFRLAGKETGGFLGAKVGREVLTVGNHNTQMQLRAADGHFPDIQSVVPKGPPVVSWAVSVDLLKRICAVLSGMDCERARFLLWGAERPLAVIAQSEDGGVGLNVELLFMPLSK